MLAMHERDELRREGLPPRGHSADVPEHASSRPVWIGGAIALMAVLGLVLFGTTRMNDTTASNPNLNAEQGVTTGAAPARK
jgi:hypothetical protein